MNDKAIKPYRLGFGQFVVGLCTLVAIVGGLAWILKQFGVI